MPFRFSACPRRGSRPRPGPSRTCACAGPSGRPAASQWLASAPRPRPKSRMSLRALQPVLAEALALVQVQAELAPVHALQVRQP
eukprot:7222863-Pyramimonas_sp.AAC.1